MPKSPSRIEEPLEVVLGVVVVGVSVPPVAGTALTRVERDGKIDAAVAATGDEAGGELAGPGSAGLHHNHVHHDLGLRLVQIVDELLGQGHLVRRPRTRMAFWAL